MKWSNHIIIATSITALVSPPLVPLAALGSTAPDWLEWLYKATTGHWIKHRGVTHYVVYWLGGAVFGWFIWDYHHVITAFSLGGLSHVLADACTISGVPFSGWSDRRFHLFGGRFRTGQPGEFLFAGAVAFVCLAVAMLTRHWGSEGFSPFFYDWADYYHDGLVDAHEWKENRFRWF